MLNKQLGGYFFIGCSAYLLACVVFALSHVNFAETYYKNVSYMNTMFGISFLTFIGFGACFAKELPRHIRHWKNEDDVERMQFWIELGTTCLGPVMLTIVAFLAAGT
jgi:hypothetical protein